MSNKGQFKSISAVGMGTFNKTGEIKEMVHYAKEYGVNMFDTSDDYGTEFELGQALLEEYNERKTFQVSTKITSPEKAISLKNELKKSINNLFHDDKDAYVDLYLIHWPYPFVYLKIWEDMIKLKECGMTRHIGVCNFNISQLKRMKEQVGIYPEVNQIEVHPLFAQKEICDFCQSNNITIMCYSPFGRGGKELIENDTLVLLAKKYKVNVQQIILRWDIQKGYIPIPASSSPKHIRDNSIVYDFSISEGDMKTIDALDVGLRYRLDSKTFFSTKKKIKYLLMRITWPILKTIKERRIYE